jgi:hypothetical protein
VRTRRDVPDPLVAQRHAPVGVGGLAVVEGRCVPQPAHQLNRLRMLDDQEAGRLRPLRNLHLTELGCEVDRG